MGRRGRKRGPCTHFGVLLIDKPAGPTSHDLVSWVRWALGERAVGHCGTLDPAATGLMVLCVGDATKLVEHLSGVDKAYEAGFVLGRATTTADAQGETVRARRVDRAMAATARAALEALQGRLELPPPAYSAIKIQGRRAHELARAGDEVELPARPMAVHTLETEDLERLEGEEWELRATMSVAKGTYVRSLAEEVERQTGVPAHLGSLRRTVCGGAALRDPKVVVGLESRALEHREGTAPRWRIELPGSQDDARAHTRELLEACLQPPWSYLPFSTVFLESGEGAELLSRLLQGQRLGFGSETAEALGLPVELDLGLCAVVDHAGGRAILAERDTDERGHPRLSPRRVLRFPVPEPDENSTSTH